MTKKKPWIAKTPKKLWVFLLYDEFGTWVVTEGGPTETKWLVPGTGAN